MSKRGNNARDEQGKWDIGGGAVELGKTVEETLQEEIKDEYCADIISKEFLGYEDIFRMHDGKRTHWLALYFKVLVDPAQVKNGEPHKFDAIKWFTFHTLPPTAEIHSQGPAFFEKYKKRLF